MRKLACMFLWGLVANSCIIATRGVGQDPVADLVVLNAHIVTLDAAREQAQAMAISAGRIAALGSDEEIRKRIGPQTQTIDGRGRLVLPGFNDAHVHFLAGGQQLSSVQLRDAHSREEFTRRLREFAAQLPKGSWITGGDWDHENWPGAELPMRGWIDEATPEHPVFVRRLDGHMGLANSLALKLAKITRDTLEPPGGLIVRDASGEPTGILKDAAMAAVVAVIPELSNELRYQAARAATNHASALGVTSVQDMSGDDDVLIYRELQRRGELKTRIYAIGPLPAWERSAVRGLKAAQGDPWIRQGGLKSFADGSLGSTTAYFFEPYADDPHTRGLPSDEMFPTGAMQQRVLAADSAGLQVMIHDQANSQILSIYERVQQDNGVRDRRVRIEHAQHLRMTDIPRFKQAGVIASMQPYHCADDGRWAEKRIGSQRARGTYAFRSLLDADVALAFGSDWNVAPLDPLQGIAAAVTRRTLDGRHPNGWIPEQKISVLEAVTAYTFGSARAEFSDSTKGRLIVSHLADFVVLSQNIFEIEPTQIENTRVDVTVVDGRVVYEAQQTGEDGSKR
jgi:predicted amidohydrolase YtcJ